VERATAREAGTDKAARASGADPDVERATTRAAGTAITIRPAEPGDAEATRQIYNREVTESTVTFDLVPRSLEEQRRWLADHSGGHPALVALDDAGEVVGFASLSPYRSRPAYSTTVEDSVYVRRDRRGDGIGRALLEELVRRARAHGFHTVIARIVGGHDASLALHEACGFETVGTAREVGRKFNRWLDVVELQLLL
jgi:phosphinothricin acetyltransferase